MRFTLRQPLFSGFREFAAMASFKADRRKEEHLRDRASKLLFLDVARAFYLVVRIDKDMENLDAFTDLTRERVRELETRERLGKSRRSEILNAESQLETAQAQKAQLGGDRAAAAELLSFLTGIDAARAVLKDGLEEVAPFDSEEGFLARAGGRSDVRAQEREIESARQEVRLARGAFYPSAGFLGNYYAKRVGTQRNIDWDALFSVDLPLFQGGTARALVREAGSRLKESELRLQELRRDIRREVREAARRVNASVAGSKRLRSAFEKAAESYRLQVGEYRLGLVNNLEVLQVMNDMQDRKRDLDRALIESKVHWLELKTAAEDLPEAP
ncbi:MAG: hypothetical protein A2902_02675 [Elusimicrobia bacterium RIFCSPLOWO2_01_FULL_64_13]|nr:MAG: hypothetical protein A2902_02675 [Elusimicrobia bacterium RIFCSPLOWO2_01_FULL_64_13]